MPPYPDRIVGTPALEPLLVMRGDGYHHLIPIDRILDALRLLDALEQMEREAEDTGDSPRGCSLVYVKKGGQGWSCSAREFGYASRGATPPEAAEKALDRSHRNAEDEARAEWEVPT